MDGGKTNGDGTGNSGNDDNIENNTVVTLGGDTGKSVTPTFWLFAVFGCILFTHKGAALEFNATVYKNGETTALAASFSVSPDGCTVNESGNTARITFAAAGTYTVTAAYGGATASVTVTVVDSLT